MTHSVRFSRAAEADLLRLYDFLVQRAEALEDLEHAHAVLDAQRVSIGGHLPGNPWAYRKAGNGRRSTRRELVVPVGTSGYVALYEIASSSSVVVLAVRHQREDDFQ